MLIGGRIRTVGGCWWTIGWPLPIRHRGEDILIRPLAVGEQIVVPTLIAADAREALVQIAAGPRLAGQNVMYIESQFKAIASGSRQCRTKQAPSILP